MILLLPVLENKMLIEKMVKKLKNSTQTTHKPKSKHKICNISLETQLGLLAPMDSYQLLHNVFVMRKPGQQLMFAHAYLHHSNFSNISIEKKSLSSSVQSPDINFPDS